ncbi:Multidrug resistance protein MdtL [Streptomyces tanashiensis]
MSAEARAPPERAGAREWTALAVLGVPAVLVMMNMSVLYLALPTLSRDLDPGGPQLLWITDIYGFMVAGALITMGTLGDRVGHRRILLIGAVAFTAASVFAAYANSAGVFVAARAVQGVAAASLAPSSLSVIRNLFRDPAQRTLAITIWMMSSWAAAHSARSSAACSSEYFSVGLGLPRRGCRPCWCWSSPCRSWFRSSARPGPAGWISSASRCPW